MAYYARYKNKDYSVNLKAADSTKYPSDNTGGRNCSTTQAAGSTRVATAFYTGSTQIYAAIASQFTQTISLSNGSYIKSWSVSRGTSPEEGASIGVIKSGTTAGSTVTVYLNDTLTATATGADPGYNFTSLSAPTCTAEAGTSVYVTNPNSYACTLYYGTSSGSTTNSTSIGANSSKSVTGLSTGTTYYFTLKATNTYYTYSASCSWSSRTVSGANTLTVTGSRTGSTGNLISSSSTSCKTMYRVTLTANAYTQIAASNITQGVTVSATGTTSASATNYLYYKSGDTITISPTIISSGYSSKKLSTSVSFPSGYTTNTRYFKSNSTHNGWTTSSWDESASTRTTLVEGYLYTWTATAANRSITATANGRTQTYHGFSTVTSSKIGANSDTYFSPFGSTGVTGFNSYPTTAITVYGSVNLQNDSTNSSFDGSTLSSLNYSASLRYALLTRGENRIQINSTVSSTNPSSIQLKVHSGSGGGGYKTYARVWGVGISE